MIGWRDLLTTAELAAAAGVTAPTARRVLRARNIAPSGHVSYRQGKTALYHPEHAATITRAVAAPRQAFGAKGGRPARQQRLDV